MDLCDEINHQLTDYLFGELPVREEGEVRQHLETCESCQAAFLQLQESLMGLQEEAGVVPPVEPLSFDQRQEILAHAAAQGSGSAVYPMSAKRRWRLRLVLKLAAAVAVIGGVWLIVFPRIQPAMTTVHEGEFPVTRTASAPVADAPVDSLVAEAEETPSPDAKGPVPVELKDADARTADHDVEPSANYYKKGGEKAGDQVLMEQSPRQQALKPSPPPAITPPRSKVAMPNAAAPELLDVPQATGEGQVQTRPIEASKGAWAKQEDDAAADVQNLNAQPTASEPKADSTPAETPAWQPSAQKESRQAEAIRNDAPVTVQNRVAQQQVRDEIVPVAPRQVQPMDSISSTVGQATQLVHRLTLDFPATAPSKIMGFAKKARTMTEDKNTEVSGCQLVASPLTPGAYVMVCRLVVNSPGEVRVRTTFDAKRVVSQRLLQVVPPKDLQAALVYEYVPVDQPGNPAVLQIDQGTTTRFLASTGEPMAWAAAPVALKQQVLSGYLRADGGDATVRERLEELMPVDAKP